MEQNSKRKDIIKNFAIIFLAVLLVLTFFSNTIQNYSLPEVAAQYTNSGSITNKVRGQGVVESADPYSVEVKFTRKIDSVVAKVGDEVAKGDVLYILEEGESDELKTAEKELESLQNQYDVKIITEQVSAGVSNAVVSGTSGSVSDKQAKIQAAQKKADSAEEIVKALENMITLWESGTGAEVAERKTLEDAKKELTAWTEQDSMNSAEISRASNNVNAAEKAFLDKYGVAYESKLEGYSFNDVSNNDASEANYNEKVKAITDARKDLAFWESSKDNSAYQIVYAQYAVNEAQRVIDEKLSELQYQKKAADAAYEAAQKDLTELVSDIGTTLSLEALLKQINDKKAEIEELKNGEGSTEVTAPVSGTILSMGKVAGETINQGDSVATIQAAGKGYTLSMTVPNEQAVLIKVGDEAEVQNSWWYSDVHARITSIRPDPNSPATSKKVIFELEGEVSNGQTLSLTVGKRTSNYDNIVPTSAIREDNNGKFIYRIISKSTPLGNRYILERVDVKVLAEDDTQSAVSGALEGWDYIVTTSSKPLSDGQQVRLKD